MCKNYNKFSFMEHEKCMNKNLLNCHFNKRNQNKNKGNKYKIKTTSTS